MTAVEIIRAMRRSPHFNPSELQLVVIQLQNAEVRTRDDYQLGRNDLTRELAAPLVGLLHGHTAVGSWIEKRTCDGISDSNCIVLSLQDFAKGGDPGVPFAWSLTVNSERRVERAIEALLNPKTCTAKEAIELIRLLEPRRSICH